jgi:hypothetical protein
MDGLACILFFMLDIKHKKGYSIKPIAISKSKESGK